MSTHTHTDTHIDKKAFLGKRTSPGLCRSQKIIEYNFKLQQVEELLASMETFIEAVMSKRKVMLVQSSYQLCMPLLASFVD